MSNTVEAGTETPQAPRTWPMIDPVAGVWPESHESRIRANGQSAQEKGLDLLSLANIPSSLP